MNTLAAFGRGAAIALALGAGAAQAWSDSIPLAPGALERAASLLDIRAFGPAADSLRQLLAVDPSNRRAKELLAFALESTGELGGERRVRAALAAEFQGDAGLQADYGRVLERSGDEGGALRAYRRAWELSPDSPPPWLNAAIARMRGRTAAEVVMPTITILSDPDATASAAQVGAAIPCGTLDHASLLAKRSVADHRRGRGARSQAEVIALTLVHRRGTGGFWSAGPRLHRLSTPGGSRADMGVGGAIFGRTALGSSLEADWRGEVETAWDEAAITLLHGGRTTFAEGRLYAPRLDRRLLLQLGARRRQISIVDPAADERPRAWQSLLFGGADLVLWSDPHATLRGEMLDESLIAPAARSSAVTLAYRHYDIFTHSNPEFAALLVLAPRGTVDEASVLTSLVSPRGGLRLDLRTGLARDATVRVREWRVGGAVVWAPRPSTRFSLGYDEATDVDAGLPGRRRAGGLSVHADF